MNIGTGRISVKYTNKKGNPVEVEVTQHALLQFFKRWNTVNLPEQQFSTLAEAANSIPYYFEKADRVKNLSQKEKDRMGKYGNGKDTIYFRTSLVTFVVCNGIMTTVELSSRDNRGFN